MKRALIAAILLSLATPVLALDKCFTGNWYPNTDDGTGITLEVLEDSGIVAGHYYKWMQGDKDHYVFVTDNDLENGAAFSANQSFWGIDGPTERHAGTGSIEVIDNNTIHLEWDQVHEYAHSDSAFNWCLGCNESKEMVRLTQPIPCD
jgi:hypothetical protein